MKHEELTQQIIKAFYTVYNALGYGFLENVYQNALIIELRKADLQLTGQQPIKVYYDHQVVGEYFADLVVEGSIIVELKAVNSLLNEHEAQLLNYLNATRCEVGLLLNFGPKPEVKRKVFDNDRKRYGSPND
ncbi:MAG: GxxExxY protein [Anaerolineae bacterium]|nr:GxxExxY protein [Anaerolineae bacterium]